nr:GtrA family protein [Prevotella sp.]
MGHIKHEIWTLSKAEMSSTVSSIVDFGLAIGLSEIGMLPYQWSNIIGVMSGGITNCCLNYRFVFKNTSRTKKGVAWRYLMVWFGSMTFNGLGTNMVTSYFGAQWFIIVKCVIAVIIAIFFNYPLQHHFVFKIKKNE